MNKNLMGLILVLALAATGCGTSEDSDDVNQARIYTDYELFYNANEDVTHAIARFRFGGPFGTILELTGSSGAGVTFDGQPLAYSGLWGGHHREYAGNRTAGTFRYTNTEGEVFVNDVPGNANRYVRHPEGVDKVIVNGALVVDQGKYTDARTGQVV